MPSPTSDPGNVAAELMTKIDRWLVQRYLRGSLPELKLNAVTAAAMAIVVARSRHAGIHRERAVMARREACNGQVPYHCTPDRFEGWKPSKSNTCSIVISLRTVSKSTPGTVLLTRRRRG
jgi:hypothetical protein